LPERYRVLLCANLSTLEFTGILRQAVCGNRVFALRSLDEHLSPAYGWRGTVCSFLLLGFQLLADLSVGRWWRERLAKERGWIGSVPAELFLVEFDA
jgi:hypothetical protein